MDDQDINIPESPRAEFIRSTEYAKKHGLHKRKLAHLCRKNVLISKKVTIFEKKANKEVNSWFILDIPLEEHPGWEEHNATITKRCSKPLKRQSLFLKKVEEYRKRFNEARMKTERATFTQWELSRMLGTQSETIRRWTEVGIKDYGKLPKIEFPDDKRGQIRTGRVDFYYHQKDIIRFLNGELKDPTLKFKTIDDAIVQTEIDEIALRHGFYIYNQDRVYPATYDGFIKWSTTKVYVYNRRTRKKELFRPNEKQRELYRNAFAKNKDGTFKHRYICLSRPRGEYKTFDACLLILFRFFNLPEETIFLVANSERQTTHLLFNEAVKIIRRSPELLNTSGLDIETKEINLMSGKKEIYNSITITTVESGPRSNATCFGFSEIYKMTNEAAYAEIDGSIRSVVDAWLIIESTVAPKGHVFQRLHEAYQKGQDPLLYFQHYEEQYYNPETTKDQLAHFQTIFLPSDYKRFFINRWEDATTGLFDATKIFEIGVAGMKEPYILGPSHELIETINEIVVLQRKITSFGDNYDVRPLQQKISQLKSNLIFMDDLYKLPATAEDLNTLRQTFGCEFIIGVGLDRAKKIQKRHDRTVLTTVAKGILSENLWFCFVLDIFIPMETKMEHITNRILNNTIEYGWIDYIDIEEYLSLDIHNWCLDKGYESNLMSANYKHQEEMFTLLWEVADAGYVKCPSVPMWTDEQNRLYYNYPPQSKGDIFREELSAFAHQPSMEGKKVGYFGSIYKKEWARTKLGEPKDDTIFSLGHSVFAANRGDMPFFRNDLAFSVISKNSDSIGTYE